MVQEIIIRISDEELQHLGWNVENGYEYQPLEISSNLISSTVSKKNIFDYVFFNSCLNEDKSPSYLPIFQITQDLIKPADIRQNRIGNCAFLAPLITLTQQNPDYISQLVTVNKEGHIKVTLFFDQERKIIFLLDSTKIIKDNKSNSHTHPKLFLLEKAYAILSSLRALEQEGTLDLNNILWDKNLGNYNLLLQTNIEMAYQTLLGTSNNRTIKTDDIYYTLEDINTIFINLANIENRENFLSISNLGELIFGTKEYAINFFKVVKLEDLKALFNNLKQARDDYKKANSILNTFFNEHPIEGASANLLKIFLLHTMFKKRLPNYSSLLIDFIEEIDRYLKSGYVLSATTLSKISNQLSPTGEVIEKSKGLVIDHAYAVMNAVQLDDNKYYLVLINPWVCRYGRIYSEKVVTLDNERVSKLTAKGEDNEHTYPSRFFKNINIFSPTKKIVYSAMGDEQNWVKKLKQSDYFLLEIHDFIRRFSEITIVNAQMEKVEEKLLPSNTSC